MSRIDPYSTVNDSRMVFVFNAQQLNHLYLRHGRSNAQPCVATCLYRNRAYQICYKGNHMSIFRLRYAHHFDVMCARNQYTVTFDCVYFFVLFLGKMKRLITFFCALFLYFQCVELFSTIIFGRYSFRFDFMVIFLLKFTVCRIKFQVDLKMIMTREKKKIWGFRYGWRNIDKNRIEMCVLFMWENTNKIRAI